MKYFGRLAFSIFLIFTISLFVLLVGYASWQFGYRSPLLLHLGWAGLVFTILAITFSGGHRFISYLIRRLIGSRKAVDREGAETLNAQRRLFLSRTVEGGIVLFSSGLTCHGWLNAADLPELREIPLRIKGLHKHLDGFRIVQLSDLHIDIYTERSWIEAIVGMANALKPDLIAVTGDLADAPVDRVIDVVSPLSELSSPYGSYFVTGNHEYYTAARGVGPWITHLRGLGLDVLLNEHRVISRGGGTVLVCGVTDLEAVYSVPEHISLPSAAIQNAPKTDVKMLMAHQPKSIYQASEAGFDFQLSGHTHGGQFFPGQVIMAITHPFLRGLHHYRQMQIYVNSGVGFIGPRIRLGSESEIVAITLVAA